MENLPFVTVVMAVRNESAFIKRSLNAVLNQDYPSSLIETIISDGKSTDNTRSIIEALKAKHSNLRLLDNQGQIVPTGLNDAIRLAKGEIIVRVDGHTIIEPDYVRECVEALTRSKADNVGGRMNAISEQYFGKVVACATSTPFGVGGARFHYSEAEEWVDTVYLGAWDRTVFIEVGLFDEEQVRGEDCEFNYRLLASGGKILLSPRIRSRYYNRSSWRKLWRQYFEYGYWKVRVMQKHTAQMRLRQFAPPLFVLALLLSLLAALFSESGRWLFLAVAGSYMIGNICASVLSARKFGWRLLPLLPIAFSTLHIGYGSGFLFGMIRFAHLWGDHGTGLNYAPPEIK